MNGTMTDGAAYRAWERAIRDLDADELPKSYEKLTFYALAVMIASHGTNGKRCFPAQTTLARDLGCSRTTIGKYRKLLVKLGWFTEDKYRHLHIAIPAALLCEECGRLIRECEKLAECWQGEIRVKKREVMARALAWDANIAARKVSTGDTTVFTQ